MRQLTVNATGLRKARSGQTTAEYAIIVALVAVCSIAVIMVFGDQIRALIGAESATIGGQPTNVQVIDPTTAESNRGIGHW
jgi:Flp pilus assembly pilin Flp